MLFAPVLPSSCRLARAALLGALLAACTDRAAPKASPLPPATSSGAHSSQNEPTVPPPSQPAPSKASLKPAASPPPSAKERGVERLENYAWKNDISESDTLASRVTPPDEYERAPTEAGSFASWLRSLPIRPGRPAVLLHDGREKPNQEAHAFVIDIETGRADLQQCADAVMRLRGEYLFAQKSFERLHFNFTTGDRASYAKWRQGHRPKVDNNRVSWARSAGPDASYEGFRRYMRSVFTYAGTASLSRELKPIDVMELQAGDVFIIGGYPGHAVLVMDVAKHKHSGKKVFLLAQSYMPAQDMHVLKNPENTSLSPWYDIDFGAELVTPEWTFKRDQLMRFDE